MGDGWIDGEEFGKLRRKGGRGRGRLGEVVAMILQMAVEACVSCNDNEGLCIC